ncbi:toll/interleukin-1 receptor domain-containing adapter protein [Salarias fasciatus]|uniref:TIR domain-containing protein n=1 Tax=Salarias fasciatus TaxID=181472 RepID=A0A672ISP8_SALFA|nr:toll/interleukin-1 receptor domain-containing adapter protein [Salarias fasciatus]
MPLTLSFQQVQKSLPLSFVHVCTDETTGSQHNGALNMEVFWRRVDDMNMNGWFQKFYKKKLSFLAQHEKDINETKGPQTSGNCVQPLTLTGTAPSTQSVLDSEVRWKWKYDVFVCHSNAHSDIEEATRLVSFLEGSPHRLRCFLWQRDTCPGGAVSTEFCQAVQDSHLRALLITPTFVKDDWCGYMMHQAIAEGPMSNRMIPMIQNLHHCQYPPELKFYYYIDLSKNPLQGYTHVKKTILKNLEYLLKKEMVLKDGIMGVSHRRLEPEDKLTPSKHGHTETSIPLEVTPK